MNRLKKLREEHGVKQKDLALFLNITQATLSNWERGRHDIDSKSLIKLADYFNVTTDYILGFSKIQGLSPSIEQIADNRIKELRIKKGMKQSELSKVVNVRQTTVSNWENEVTEIDKRSLFALADYFNVTTDYLLGKSNNPTPTDSTIPHKSHPISVEDFLAQHGITDKGRADTLNGILDLMLKAEADKSFESSNDFLEGRLSSEIKNAKKT